MLCEYGWFKKVLGFCLIGLFCIVAMVSAGSEKVTVAEDGRARLPVVTGEGACDRVRLAAAELADMLGRMAGCRFELKTGAAEGGIMVGRPEDFAALPLDLDFDPDDPRRREEYILLSRDGGLFIIGATALAVESAVWDTLYRLGHRRFFAHRHWDVVPDTETIRLQVDVLEAPDFLNRRLWTGHGTHPENSEDFGSWLRRNRARTGFPIWSSHVYGRILSARSEVFEQHPEYLGLVDGERRSSKFCISNPGLREVVIDWALEYFDNNPDALSVSMEPSDGGDWCECENCAEIGSISDRMILLCNVVAEAVTDKYPNKYVGTLSYYKHTDPPNIDIHPHVAVNIATGLRTGGLSIEELISGWREKGAEIVGLSYNVGGPSAMRNIPRVASEFKKWYSLGINRVVVDINDRWGTSGLGNYLLARILWDIDESDRVDELLDDFFERAFGVAREPMEEWFDLTYLMREDDLDRPVTEDRLGRMYRALAEALELSDAADVRKRIGDLAIYTRILEMMHYSEGDEASSAELMRFIWRTRDRQVVHSRRMFNWPRFYRLSGYQTIPVNRMSEGYSPWKDSRPVRGPEILSIVAKGVERNEIADVSFEPIAFSDELMPAKEALGLREARSSHMGRGDHYYGRKFYTWVDEAPAEIRMTVRSGRTSGGSPKVMLYSAQTVDVTHDSVDSDRSTPAEEGSVHEIVLKTSYEGLHWVEVHQGGSGTRVSLQDPAQARTLDGSPGASTWAFPAWSLLFYVPEGTETVGGFAARGRGIIRDGSGDIVFVDGHIATSEQREWGMGRWNRWRREREEGWDGGYFEIPVPEGQDGRLWSTYLTGRRWYLLTVPPYFAETSEQLLLPREVIERDAAKE